MHTVLPRLFQGVSGRIAWTSLVAMACLISASPLRAETPASTVPKRPAFSFAVLPVFHTPEGTLLWEPDNLWRSVWQGASLELSGGALVVPPGSESDKSIVSAEAAKDAGFGQLRPFTERYGVKEV